MPRAGGLQAARRRPALLGRPGVRRAVLAVLAFATLAAAAIGVVALTQGSGAPAARVQSAQAPDLDGDGVPDVVENVVLGTNPGTRASSAALPEAWIYEHGYNVADVDLAGRYAAYPRAGEAPRVYGPDGLPPEDRMTIGEVYAYGRPPGWNEESEGAWDSKLDPRQWDVNDSGVPYSWLIRRGIDPFDRAALDRPAAPGVPWTPREAWAQGLDPRSTDGDADGLDDLDEISRGLDPRKLSTAGTGAADGWLLRFGFDPLDAASAYADHDRDGLTNVEEYLASVRLYGPDVTRGGGLDPRAQASGGSRIPDGWLAERGFDPLRPGVDRNVTERLFENGTEVARLTVYDEYLVNRPPLWNETVNGPWRGGTDPSRSDTDGDGLDDVAEISGWNVTVNGEARRVRADPTVVDSDADGLLDAEERRGAAEDLTFRPTDPSAPDTDFDGLRDGEETGRSPWHDLDLSGLDPTREDTDEDGLADGTEADMWLARRAAYLAGASYEWGPPERPGPLVAMKLASLDALLPTSDVDADGLANVLDPDSDGDGLLDGWEVEPENYARSRFAALQGRTVTDPASRDTDVDTLPDAWEVEFGLYDPENGGWNLDPAQWSSLRDGVSDADADLDDDSITWYSYKRTPSGTRATSHVYSASNAVEYSEGSHPNRRDTDRDGVPDGWKIFWGKVYLDLPPEEIGDVYPGAPGELTVPSGMAPPRIGEPPAGVVATLDYVRFALLDEPVLAWETVVRTYENFRDSGGAVKSFRMLQGRVEYDAAAQAANSTNPYLADTDGDGAPDTWEGVWARLQSPKGRLTPTTPDGLADFDEDGVANVDEYLASSNPYRADSDFDGASDRLEADLRLDPLRPEDGVRALSSTLDTDGDGAPDHRETLGTASRADGSRIVSDPLDPDSDRDGLWDGPSLSSRLGRRADLSDPAVAARMDELQERGIIVLRFPDGTADVLGEQSFRGDPARFSTGGDGISDGWKALRSLDPPEQMLSVFAKYSYGRPSWWNDTRDGTWKWGLEKNETPTDDHDRDGLHDLNGEDPFPFARRAPFLPPEDDPLASGIGAMERLRRSQRYGDVDDATPEVPARAQLFVSLDTLPPVVSADGTGLALGNVTLAGGRPAPNVTVVLEADGRVVVGAGITDEAGRFSIPILLAENVSAPADSEGVAVFGA
ncbi:MAG TPA: hypothetical protein VHH36_00260, partial [Candidatus Thermoplasmatota archaeon]|nr:hypothetical protein [Candidatus Thermoplasmatota archaeon]